MVDILFLHEKGVRAQLKNGEFQAFGGEEYCQIKLSRPAGKDYFVLFYPYREREAAPRRAELLAPGVARVVTSASEDYLFASTDEPVSWDSDTVSLEGYAGMVRVKGNRAELINASSQTATLRFGKAEKSGPGPWEARAQGSSAADVARAPLRKSPSKPPGKNVVAVGPGVTNDDPQAQAEGITGWVAIDGETGTLYLHLEAG
jgi:hypothetical protein